MGKTPRHIERGSYPKGFEITGCNKARYNGKTYYWNSTPMIGEKAGWIRSDAYKTKGKEATND